MADTFDIIMNATKDFDAGGAENDDTADLADDITGDESDEPEVDGDEGDAGDEGEDDETPIAERTNDDEDDEADGEAGDEDDEDVDPAVADAARRATGQDELDKLLDEYGFKLPKLGQRENRLPPARVRARVKTVLQKEAARFGGQITEITGRLTAAQARVDEMERIDALLAQTTEKPELARQYIEMLATLHPSFKPFLAEGGIPAGKAEPSQALKDLGPMPQPDITYDDGSKAYSPEAWQKRDDWLMSKAAIQAEERLTKQFEGRLKPIETEREAERRNREEAPKIAAAHQHYRSVYGKYFTDQEAMEMKQKGSSDISKYRVANPQATFAEAVQAVLVPKMLANRTTMRQEILGELRGKKRAASRVAGGQQTRTRRPERKANRSTIDIIAAAADGLGGDDEGDDGE